MKTQQAIALAGTATKLASLLEITSGAVSQWGEDVPQGRVWQLRVLRPHWFELGQEQIAAAQDEQATAVAH